LSLKVPRKQGMIQRRMRCRVNQPMNKVRKLVKTHDGLFIRRIPVAMAGKIGC
jgi:hypothetical protein